MASKFQSKTIADLKAKGWLVIKTIQLSANGYPDLFCFRNGTTMFIECKEPSDRLSELQKYRIDELIKLGFEAKCLQAGKGQIYPPLP